VTVRIVAVVEPTESQHPTAANTERMAAGDWYITDDAVLEIQRTRQTLMERFNAIPVAAVAERRDLLAELMGSVGERTDVRAPVYVDYGSNVHLGSDVFLNFGCILLDVAPVTIGDHCQIGPHVQFLTPIHPLDAQRRRDLWETAAPITLGDNVWVGGGAIICPGVTIGENAVVGAGAVVVTDIPAGTLAVGNPAKVIRQLT
jgi:maltose O-acetyltransferase